MANDALTKAISGNPLRDGDAGTYIPGNELLAYHRSGINVYDNFGSGDLAVLNKVGTNRLYYTTGAADPNPPAAP